MKQTLLLAILFGVAFSASAQRINQTFTHLNGDKEIVNVADIAAVYPRGTGSTLALGPSLHTMDVTESQSNILSVSGGLIQSLTEVLSGYTVTQTRTVLIALQHVSTVTYIGNSQIGNVCRIQLRNPSMSINVRGTFAQVALILTKNISASFNGVIVDETLTGSGITGDTLGLAQQGATSGQVMTWDGSAWVPADPSSGGHVLALNETAVAQKDTMDFVDNASILFSLNNVAGRTEVTAVIDAGAVSSSEILNGSIAAVDLGQMGATSGQVLKWNGSVWAPAADNTGGGGGSGGHVIMGAGTPTTQRDSLDFLNTGNVNFTIADATTKTTVVGTLAQQSATSGQVLKWNGSSWAPGTDNDGAATVGNLTAGSSKVTVTGGAGAVIGSGASVDVVQANLALSSIGGSLNLSQIAQSSATTGQIPKWNGTAWVASADSVLQDTTSFGTVVYTFSTAGTDTVTIPVGAKSVQIVTIGAGGGGGSGRKGATGTNRFGGMSGASGNGSISVHSIASLNTTKLVAIRGAGGAGGASVTVNSTNGSSGSSGGTTYVYTLEGKYVSVSSGGGGGGGGTTAAGTLPSLGTTGLFLGIAPQAACPGLSSTNINGGSGGLGGLVNTSNTASVGCDGGYGFYATVVGGTGGAAGTGGGTATAPTGGEYGGGGGGGGGGSNTTNAGAGGNGVRGGGGGGGGGATNSVGNSGAGGTGGNGYVQITFFVSNPSATISAGTGISIDPSLVISSTITQYTDEAAQDAVGGILVDGTTIDFTYSDGTPSITAELKQQSATSGQVLKWSGSSWAPGTDNDSQTLSIDSTTVGVKETFRLSISGGNTVAFDIGNDNIYNSSGSIAHDVSRNVSIMTNSSLNFLDSLTGEIAGFSPTSVSLMNGVGSFTTNSATFTTTGGQVALGSNLTIDMTGGYMSTTMSGGDQWGLYYSTGTAIIVDETQNLSLFSPNQNQAFTMDDTYSTWSFSSGADASIGLGTGGIGLTADTITASPNSGGNIVLKINEPALSGSNYTGFTTAAMSSDRIYTLPTDTPSDGDVLGWHTGNLLSWDTPSGGGGVSDGDKGDITVSSSGSVWTIDNDVVTYAKMQNVSATARIMGRNTAGAGDMEELDASTVKTMLSLNNVENTALSTWAGSTNITTLGTISTGTVPISKVSSATLASTLTGTLGASVKFQIAYDGGNQGLTIDDGANSGSMFSKDGNQYFSADNTLLYLGAGGFNAETFAATTGVQTALQLVANTNTVNAVRTWATNSSGTAATGFGQRTLFQLESSTTNAQDAAAIDILWSDATHASRTADIVFSTVASAAALAEAFRIGGTAYQLTATAAVANTNSAVDRLVIRTNSTGTAAANFGATVSFYSETSTTDNTYQAGFGPSWTTATHASRTSGMGIYGVNSGTNQTLAWFQAATAPYLVINNGVTGTQYANAGITIGANFTLGGTNTLTLGGSSGLVNITTSNGSNGAINISSSSSSISGAGIYLGNSSYSSATLAKTGVRLNDGYSPTSGTGTYIGFELSGTMNQTGGSSGIIRGFYFNHTLTAVADYRAIDIASNSANAKGVYQTGASTTNNFVGKTTFGATTTPTAFVQIAAGTTTVAPLLLTSGTNLTSATAGALEYDGTELYFSPSTTRQKLVRSLNGSATLDFASTAAGAVSDLTITVTGAADGDPVFLGVPNASTVASGDFTAWVSAANTVTVRFANNDLITARDPASGTFKVTVQK